MKRKFLSTLLFGALACTTLSTVTSCKDYDDDINNLQNQIDALSKKIDDINSQISAGSVITSVTPTANGVTVTLSNGKSYDLTNGKDGKDGTAWTISEDGYWVKDGVKTDYKALGKDGKDGKDGADGKPGEAGKPGENGKDGIYFVPNTETGCFDKCDATGKVIEQTNISWKLSAVTGVMDNDVLTLYGIPDKNGVVNEKGIQISLSNNLRGLVFAGDAEENGEYVTTYVDAIPGIRIADFEFAAQKLNDADKQTEKTVALGGKNANGYVGNDTIRNATYAYYHVNPSNVNVEDLKSLKFDLQANDNYTTTRTAAKNLTAAAEFVSYDSENGVVKVKVNTTGVPATAEKISIVKLQATKNNDETVTSDAATLWKKDIKNVYIADKKKSEAEKVPTKHHFREAKFGIDGKDYQTNCSFQNVPVWSTTDASDIDINLTVGETIDLNDYVYAHEIPNYSSCSVLDYAKLGLAFKYEVVKNYKIGTLKTDQADFVSLNGSELTSKVYDTNGAAAIGRTPIIRITLYNTANNRIVKVAYAKVKIVKEKVADKELTIVPQDKDKGEFKFTCEGATLATTIIQTNKEIYNVVGLGRDDFHKTYSKFDENNGAKGEVGKVEEITEDIDGETTHILKWTVTAEEMWANAGKEVVHTVYYKNPTVGNSVKITLKAKVTGVEKAKDYADADRIAEYWKGDKAQFNVAVPEKESTDATKCVFKNDLNSVFKTNKDGKLDLGDGVTYSYFFCKDNEKVTKVGEYDVKFSVSKDGLTLSAALKNAEGEFGAAQEVAKITNGAAAVPFNYVELLTTGNAKALLNTGVFDVQYGVKANACTFEDNDIKITFKGEDHFTATFVQPVVVAAKAADKFIDGVDFGEKGSFVKLEDLIAPSDWRGRAFSDYTNYWKYYGVTKITVDKASAKCDLNHSSEKIDVPATIELNQEAASNDKFFDGYKKDDKGNVTSNKNFITSDYGFLTYKNNGSTVNEDFNLYVKVTVEYKWGTIATDYITVPVAKTIKK